MLDPWIIEEIRRREEERQHHERPPALEIRIETPQHQPAIRRDNGDEEPGQERGVVIINLGY